MKKDNRSDNPINHPVIRLPADDTPPSKANFSSHLFFSVGFSFVNDAGSVKFQ